jgi:hypothetical protein
VRQLPGAVAAYYRVVLVGRDEPRLKDLPMNWADPNAR